MNTLKHTRYTFNKEERLCSRKTIDSLFKTGQTFTVYPFRIVWVRSLTGTSCPARTVISVAKKNFKHAVIRNLIKRRIKEAYRIHKHILYVYLDNKGIQIAVMIMYTGKDIPDYPEVENKIVVSLHQLIKKLDAS